MGLLAAVERFLERLFERQSARLFRTAIRPVQVQRRLERAMEGDRTRDGSRTIVPHRFRIRLHVEDLAALRVAAPELAATLADGALAFARSHGYTLLDRPVVVLRSDRRVQTGDIAVDALDPHAAAPDDDAGELLGAAADDGPGASVDAASTEDAREPDATREAARVRAPQRAPDQTAVFVLPGIDGPHATIREVRPDQSSRSIAFDGRPLTIGRAADNGIVLRDGRASRHHARIDARRGSLVLSDLGSTNGSYVNDRRVESIALGEGDRIRLGMTTLLIEAIAADGPRTGAVNHPASATSGAAHGASDRPTAG